MIDADWVLVTREKVGAAKHKKPRKMLRSKLAAWGKSMTLNGYDVVDNLATWGTLTACKQFA